MNDRSHAPVIRRVHVIDPKVALQEMTDELARIVEREKLTHRVTFINGERRELNEEQASKLIHGLTTDSLPKFIQISGELFATHQVISVTENGLFSSAERKEELQKMIEDRTKDIKSLPA